MVTMMKINEITLPNINNEKIKSFTKLANDQRGAPESAMLKVTHDSLCHGTYAYLPEHVGDLTHRMSEGLQYGRSGYGYGNVKEKVEIALQRLNNAYGFEREMRENQRNNYEYMVKSKGEKRSFSEVKKDFDRKTNAYADEHQKLIVYNRVQQLAKDAAISVGRQNFDKARYYLQTLKTELDKGPEHWAQVAGEYNPTLYSSNLEINEMITSNTITIKIMSGNELALLLQTFKNYQNAYEEIPYLSSSRRNSEPHITAWHEKLLVGDLELQESPKQNKWWFMHVAVRNSYLKNGISKKLLIEAFRYLTQQKAIELTVSSFTDIGKAALRQTIINLGDEYQIPIIFNN